jgi:hypothetical protein
MNTRGIPISGSTTARGYGGRHQAERKRWAPLVAAGDVACARCGLPIAPGMAWDLGHTEDRNGWTGPEHMACNRIAGARKGTLRAEAKRRLRKRLRRW